MVVAVIAVRVVQVPIDEVVGVVAVWYRLVAATELVDVAGLVAVARVIGGAGVWMGCVDADDVLIDVTCVGVVQVTAVQVVDVTVVVNGGMAAVGTVLVGVIGMRLMQRHERHCAAKASTWPNRWEQEAFSRLI